MRCPWRCHGHQGHWESSLAASRQFTFCCHPLCTRREQAPRSSGVKQQEKRPVPVSPPGLGMQEKPRNLASGRASCNFTHASDPAELPAVPSTIFRALKTQQHRLHCLSPCSECSMGDTPGFCSAYWLCLAHRHGACLALAAAVFSVMWRKPFEPHRLRFHTTNAD